MPATPRPLPSLLLLLVGCATISHGTALRFPRFGNPFATSTSCQRPSSQNGAEPGAVSITPEGDFVFVPDQHTPHAVAWGSYVDSAHTSSNFGQLRINTSGNYSDADQAFAAGFLEGHLTARRIYQQYANLHTYFTKTLNASLEGPMEWVDKQDRWVRQRCASQDVGIPAPRGRATTASFLDSEDANENLSGDDAQGGLESNDHEHHHHKHHHHKHERQSTKGTNERFWKAVCLTVRQFDGVIAGYTSRAALEPNNHLLIPQMKYYDFLFLENNADLYDIIDAEDPSQGPSWNPGGDDDDDTNSTATISDENHDLLSFMHTNDDKHRKRHRPPPAEPTARDAEALFRKIALSGKCSALVKLAPDLSDLWLGHSTWDSYTAMLRIWKHYSFDFRQLNPPAQRMSFSSYPGEVFSDDDFFLLSSGLAILQTTNKIFNDDLFEGLKHKSVPSWQRIRAANWLASSGEEWTQLLDTENSGTYNNQYIVVDLNKFVPGEELRPGLLWVAEQIPGKVVAADLTSVLAMGYWPSFNVPYFPEIYGASGYPDFIRKLDEYGQHFGRTTHWLSYTNSPRAKIFRRDHPKVTSMADMAAIMRSNDWRNDPLSEGHPICAVCGRGDLDPGFPELRGCYDTKVASWASALRLEAVAVNGPTTMGARAFQWSKVRLSDTDDNGTTAHVPLHLGHPDRFNFQFERMSPREEAVGCGAAPWDDGGKEGGASVF